MSNQVEFVSLEQLVADNHRYRYFKQILSESFVSKQMTGLTKLTGRTGYGINRLFYCLLLQFMEDLSDRECEQFLLENLSAKWFCGFTLSEPTPGHSCDMPSEKKNWYQTPK